MTPSTTTIDALAAALLLTKAEHAHLRALVKNGDHKPFVRETVLPAIRRLVEGLPHPAYVTGRRWDILAWSPSAAGLFGDFARVTEADRNILVFMLLDPRARRIFVDGWAAEAKRMIAVFRATYDLWALDPSFRALYERLLAGCPELAAWWDDHDVRSVASGTKRLRHPRNGVHMFEHVSFQANDDPALKLVIYTAI